MPVVGVLMGLDVLVGLEGVEVVELVQAQEREVDELASCRPGPLP